MAAESLNLQIKANADGAVKALDNLVSRLTNLSTSLKNLNTSGLTNLASSVSQLSAAMQEVNNVGTASFTRLSRNISGLATSSDPQGLRNVASALRQLNNAINATASASVTNFTNLANGLSRLGGAASTRAIQTMPQLTSELSRMLSELSAAPVANAEITQLITGIAKLGGGNAQRAVATIPQLTTAMSAMMTEMATLPSANADIAVFISALSRLGGASAQRAITTIPLLTSKIMALLTALSRAPAISSEVTQIITALSRLNSVGTTSTVATNRLVTSLTGLGKASKTAATHTFSLAAAFGKFYATYFLVIRAVKKLWSSVESSTSYVEVLNYFEKAFEQVTNNLDTSAWEQLGYESAEAYANSFEARATQLTQKLTGYTASTSSGLATETGSKSLSLNLSDTLNYQAMFAQMASSMGVTTENATKLSIVLTEIGADLSSVKNLDFTDVWSDMASGMVGMSRTLDKYGANIRVANLQLKLNSLGIEANVDDLTQADKALLRTIVLLESSEYAWGDLAETLNKPANQVRVLKANLQMLGQTIGQLFVPMLQKVLPYLNGLVKALQNMFNWLANIWGITIDLSSSSGSIDISDYMDEIEESTEDATDAISEFKNQILSFDEVTKLSDSSSSSSTDSSSMSGLLDEAFNEAVSKYQSMWDKAYADLDNQAEKYAAKFEKALEPLKQVLIDFNIGDYFAAGQDVSKVVSGITQYFEKAVKKVDWKEIGQNIADFISGVDWDNLIYNFNNLVSAIYKAILNFFDGLEPTEIGNKIGKAISQIDWAKIFKSWLAIKINIAEIIASAWLNAFVADPLDTALLTMFGLLNFTSLGNWISKKILEKIETTVLASGIGSKLAAALTSSATSAEVEGACTTAGTSMWLLLRNAIVAGITFYGAGEITKAVMEAITHDATYSDMSFSDEISEIVKGAFSGELWDGIFNSPLGEAKASVITGLLGDDEYYDKLLGYFDTLASKKDEYLKLSEQTTWTAEEEKTMQSYVKLLELAGIDISQYVDAETGAWKDLGVQIDDVLKKQQEHLVLMKQGNLTDLEAELADLAGGSASATQLEKLWEKSGYSVKKYTELLKKAYGNVAGTTLAAGTKELVAAIATTADEIDVAYAKIGSTETANTYLKQYKALTTVSSGLEVVDVKANTYGKTLATVDMSTNAVVSSTNKASTSTKGLTSSSLLLANQIDSTLQKLGLTKTKTDELTSSTDNATTSSSSLGNSFTKTGGYATTAINAIQNLADSVQNVPSTKTTTVTANIKDVTDKLTAISNTTTSTKVSAVVGNVADALNSLKNTFGITKTTVTASADTTSASTLADKIKNAITSRLGNVGINVTSDDKNVTTVASSISEKFKKALGSVELNMGVESDSSTSKNSLTSALQKILSGVSTSLSISKIAKLKLSSYATGGFPEDGLFYANHNELVGNFTNGKTAVANNAQIVQGIADGIYPAVYNAIMEANAGNGGNQTIKVYVGNKELEDIAIDGINNRIRSSGVNPLYI